MNSPMLPTVVWLGFCHRKLLLGTKSPPKELWGDEFLVSELVPWEPLWIQKKEVEIEVGKKDAKVGESTRKEQRI